ncbi:hypothetical protein Mal4_12240 [Maioricimonas rarisocia]|uniref:DUF1570 domain-containing protein n=1 Tax=Maioricimonas rarisocia TaxID=2528026 RepID=A0A517Z376_9PLAN|nr:hypothetical protein [Maioricimonas rarisocia]QDU36923.1 hypothetical protein Mal4_12240 [Maioricimonas rarisocia]
MPMRHAVAARFVGLAVFAVILPGLLLPQSACGQQRTNSSRAGRTAAGPHIYKSTNFHVMTDLPREGAHELLERLETMHRLLVAYWGRRNPRPIEMYVVENLDHWPREVLRGMEQQGLESLRNGQGLTVTRVISQGNRFISKAVVYAVADRGMPQHEAVHAYCGHAFGASGPVWYAEGMAEVGQYWRENDKSVTASAYAIRYLRNSPARPLNEIVNSPLETTGDSWQNYTWRWALCHLLGYNENYTKRFKPLGLALLGGRRVNFWQVYGTQAQEIEFEYRLFLKDIEAGYRCDLCSWDWKTRFRNLAGSSSVSARIRANRGWQASRLRVRAGHTYRFTSTGSWMLSQDADELTADGDDQGRGRLTGILFEDYELSEPFELGADGTFTAPQDGNLYLRCDDAWGEIADNRGTISVNLILEKETAAAPPEPNSP